MSQRVIDISADANELSNRAAEWIVEYINIRLQEADRFTIALSGGSTPKKLFQLLALTNAVVDWSRVHFFWGDERYVPFDDERNNAKMATDTLLNHIPVTKENIHIMRTDIDPVQSAREYENILRQYFKDANTFDLVMLGLGDDAHTLSLFPGHPIIHEKNKWVDSLYLEQQDMYRITLTAAVVNRANKIMFLVSGASKAIPVKKVLYGEHDPMLYPAQIIQPFNGQCYWFLDTAAASEIETSN